MSEEFDPLFDIKPLYARFQFGEIGALCERLWTARNTCSPSLLGDSGESVDKIRMALPGVHPANHHDQHFIWRDTQISAGLLPAAGLRKRTHGIKHHFAV